MKRLILLAVGFLAGVASAATVNVSPETFESALAAANPGDTLELAAGTYTASGAGFVVDKAVTIRGVSAESVIVDGEIKATTVFKVTAASGTVAFENLTVKRGKRRGVALGGDWKTRPLAGNAVENYLEGAAANISFTGCVFTGNGKATDMPGLAGDASYGLCGRGVCLVGTGANTATLSNCTFTDNGEVRAPETNLQLCDSTGLALYAESLSSVTMTGCVFSKNGFLCSDAVRYGGGLSAFSSIPGYSGRSISVVHFNNAKPVVSDTVFAGNRTGAHAGRGGQIVMVEGACGGGSFTGCDWKGNDSIYTSSMFSIDAPTAAMSFGPLVLKCLNETDRVSVTGCRFAYNVGLGGYTAGLNAQAGTAVVRDSAFWGNVASAVFSQHADLQAGFRGVIDIDASLVAAVDDKYFDTTDPRIVFGPSMTVGNPDFATKPAAVLAALKNIGNNLVVLNADNFPIAVRSSTKFNATDQGYNPGGYKWFDWTKFDPRSIDLASGGNATSSPAPARTLVAEGDPNGENDYAKKTLAIAPEPINYIPFISGKDHYADTYALQVKGVKGSSSRYIQFYRHTADPKWHENDYGEFHKNYGKTQCDTLAVGYPKDGPTATDRPLVVVLHSRGGSEEKGGLYGTAGFMGNDGAGYSPDNAYMLFLDCMENHRVDFWWGAMPAAHTLVNAYAGTYYSHVSYNGLSPMNGELFWGPTEKEFEVGPGGGGYKGVITDLEYLHRGESACEKRVMDSIEWVVRKFKIDRNRIYLGGNSMGGEGTLALGLPHGDVFAAIHANVPATIWAASVRMGFIDKDGKDVADADYVAPKYDPPVCWDWSGSDDAWSRDHDVMYRNMAKRRFFYMGFWGDYGHCGSFSAAQKKNDLVGTFDFTQIVKNEAYPVFANASTDNSLPWPQDSYVDGDRGVGKIIVDEQGHEITTGGLIIRKGSDIAGQVNGWFRWNVKTDSAEKFEIDLKIGNETEIPSAQFARPSVSYVDVTPRRLQNFKPTTGKVKWTFGGYSGVTAIDPNLGVYTITQIPVTQTPLTLKLEAVPADTPESRTELENVAVPPTAPAAVTYDGNSHKADLAAMGGSNVEITGNTGWTNAGKYTLTVSPKSGYIWPDGSAAPLSYTFEIVQAENTWTTEPSLEPTSWEATKTPGAITSGAARFGTVVASHSSSDLAGLGEGEYNLVFTVAETANYKGLEKTVPFTVKGIVCEHDWSLSKSVAATCEAGGYDEYKCSKCQKTERRNATAALGHDYVKGSCTRCHAADPEYKPEEPDPDDDDDPAAAGSLRNGPSVFASGRARVAFLGGSITQNDGYRTKLMSYLQATYPNTAFDFVCNGLSSTTSSGGAFRLPDAILDGGRTDVLFVEFAVNDEPYDYTRSLKGMEGIIRQTRTANPKTDILMTLFVSPTLLNNWKLGNIPACISAHLAVAERYGVTVVNAVEALAEAEKAGTFSWAEYADIHPSAAGTAFVFNLQKAALVAAGWDGKTLPTAGEYALPEPLDAASWSRGHWIAPKRYQYDSGWTYGAGGASGGFTMFYDMSTATWSETAGAKLTVAFSGTDFGGCMFRTSAYSTFKIRIDGGAEREIAIDQGEGVPFTDVWVSGLADTAHTAELTVVSGKICIYRLVANGARDTLSVKANAVGSGTVDFALALAAPASGAVEIQVASDAAFSSIVKTASVASPAVGENTATISGLTSGATYWARAKIGSAVTPKISFVCGTPAAVAPSGLADRVYTGEKLYSGIAAGAGYTVNGDDGWIACGRYAVTLKLDAGWVWNDGTTADRVYRFSILPRPNAWTVVPKLSATNLKTGDAAPTLNAFAAQYGTATVTLDGAPFNPASETLSTARGDHTVVVAVPAGETYEGISETLTYRVATAFAGTVTTSGPVVRQTLGGDLLLIFSNSTETTSFTVSADAAARILCVGGGGSGGNQGGGNGRAGGGGAGGFLDLNDVSLATGTYTVGVGKGGAGVKAAYQSGGAAGKDGEDSFVRSGDTDVARALGGGGGGGDQVAARSGGSGGGSAMGKSAGGATQPGSAFGGYGHAGAVANVANNNGGGGGGAGQAGLTGSYGVGGKGGGGSESDIGGSVVCYAGGGGGAGVSERGAGGAGGGGAGSFGSYSAGVAGTDGLGGGGGGCSAGNNGYWSGRGGNGIVIVRIFGAGEGGGGGGEDEPTAKVVAVPTIAPMPYTGKLQVASVPANDGYTVIRNAGGTDVGSYEVELELAEGYAWADESTANKVVTFEIQKGANSWGVTPDLTPKSWKAGAVTAADITIGCGVDRYFVNGTPDRTAAELAALPAGAYTLTITTPSTKNYDGMTMAIPFTVEAGDEPGPGGDEPVDPNPAMMVSLTFDDGYGSHYSVVAPTLEKYGYRGTFNIVVNQTGRSRSGATMDWPKVADLAARGHEIALHSKSHPVSLLDGWDPMPESVLRYEMDLGQQQISQKIGVPCRIFCFPGNHVGKKGELESRAALAGMLPETPNRIFPGTGNFKAWFENQAKSGAKSITLMFHGCNYDSGYQDLSKAQFEEFAQTLKECEDEGLIRVVTYWEADALKGDSSAVAVPYVPHVFYDGTVRSPVVRLDGCEMTPFAGATDAGEYELSFSLADPDHRHWVGGGTGAKKATFIIEKSDVWLDAPKLSRSRFAVNGERPTLNAFVPAEGVTATLDGQPFDWKTGELANTVGEHTLVFTAPASKNFTALTRELTYVVTATDESLAWVETDGASYFDPQVRPGSNTTVTVEYATDTLPTDKYPATVFGSHGWDETYFRFVQKADGATAADWGGTSDRVLQLPLDREWHALTMGVNGISRDGGTFAPFASDWFGDSTNLFFGADNLGWDNDMAAQTVRALSFGRIRYRSIEVRERGVLVRALRPVRIGGEAGLWDDVEARFYGNAFSSGTILGSDEPPPAYAAYDGEVSVVSGEKSTVDGQTLLTFVDPSATGHFTLTKSAMAWILVIGGGGSGAVEAGHGRACGGNGGAFVERKAVALPAGTYDVVVGAGGAAVQAVWATLVPSNDGAPSSVSREGEAEPIVAAAGGAGGKQGDTRLDSGNGGKGAGQAGFACSDKVGGNGGYGEESAITGAVCTYAAGGGGSGMNTAGRGGVGGGGNGATTSGGNGGSGADGTGAGGGAASNTGRYSGKGGNGVVYVRILGLDAVCEHEWTFSRAVPATCEAGGYDEYACPKCEGTKRENETAALGHLWTVWTTNLTDCAAGGTRTRTCDRTGCEASETETIPAGSHDWYVASSDDEYDYYKCRVCVQEKKEAKGTPQPPVVPGSGDAEVTAADGTFAKYWDNGDLVLVFSNVSESSSFALDGSATANVLVIGGGGPGGSASQWGSAAGGGAGGFVESNGLALVAGTYSVSVGKGGVAPVVASGSWGDKTVNTVGGDSKLSGSGIDIVAKGGGGGGMFNYANAIIANDPRHGRSGGSGGGSVWWDNAGTPGTGTAGQGFDGAKGTNGQPGAGGGAGGAASGMTPGAGLESAITGTSTVYAAGGAAGSSSGNGVAGANGLGNGGAGAGKNGRGGAGGNGVVVVRLTFAGGEPQEEPPTVEGGGKIDFETDMTDNTKVNSSKTVVFPKKPEVSGNKITFGGKTVTMPEYYRITVEPSGDVWKLTLVLDAEMVRPEVDGEAAKPFVIKTDKVSFVLDTVYPDLFYGVKTTDSLAEGDFAPNGELTQGSELKDNLFTVTRDPSATTQFYRLYVTDVPAAPAE